METNPVLKSTPETPSDMETKPELKPIPETPSAEEEARESVDCGISTPLSLQKDYLFVEELGHGAQAKLYKAICLSNQKIVTIKQLNIGSVKTWKEYDLFQREAKVLESLNIPGVARFYDAIDCLDDAMPCSYIIQEYIEGASLAQMLKAGHRFTVGEVYDILIQLLKILSKLHGMTPPVIHRDIKPSNIMITPHKLGYRVTLIDFGAVANPQVQSGGSTVAGTIGYMPPEQLMGRPEPASDIYALAAVAVELFTGKSPADLPQKDFMLIFEPEMEQMPPVLLATLRNMLIPNVQDRLKNVDELIERFEQFKSNNYTLKKIQKKDIDRNRQFNEKLESVQSIGEDGNMAIWQELSDEAPRQIPDAIYSRYFKDTEPGSKVVWEPTVKRRINGTFILLAIFTMIPMLLFMIAGGGMMFLGIVLGLFSLVFIYHAFSGTNVEDYDLEFTGVIDKNDQREMIQNMFELLTQGRKTIATITDVSYVRLKSSDVVFSHERYICNFPSFKVSYKFNPPDDSKKEDLIHECIVHTSPEGLYKPGDPLPIIYTVKTEYWGEKVCSMPFPFSMLETEKPGDIISIDVNMDYCAQSEKLDCDSYEYKEHFSPILKHRNNPEQLARELQEHAWLIDGTSLGPLLNVGSQLMESNIKDKEMDKVHECLIAALSCSLHFLLKNKKQNQYKLVDSFLRRYVSSTNKHITEGAIRGIFSTHYGNFCALSEEMTRTLMALYKSADTPDHIKRLMETTFRVPLEHARMVFQDPECRPLYAQFFRGWHCHLGDEKSGKQREHHQAMAIYYDCCMGKDDAMDIQVLSAIMHNVYFWSTIPKEFWDIYVQIYKASSGGLREKMMRINNVNKFQIPKDCYKELQSLGINIS